MGSGVAASLDLVVVIAIVTKVLGYALGLLACGGALFHVAFSRMAFLQSREEDVHALFRGVVKWSLAAALLALPLPFVSVGVGASRLSGMGLDGMVDPMMLSIAWESPIGSAAAWRDFGLIALALGFIFVLVRDVAWSWLSTVPLLAGTGLVVASYTLVGHATTSPRWLLAAVLVLHLSAVAFWFGALLPLRRAAMGLLASQDAAALLHRFGQIAAGIVGLLGLAGLVFAYVMIGSVQGLFSTAYGLLLLLKIGIVTGLLGLAAPNKLRFVPYLAGGHDGASRHLDRSIRAEALAFLVIFAVTAVFTTVAVPPVHLQ